MFDLPTRPAIGVHVSVAGGLERAFERGERLGCRSLQIFVKNAHRWRAAPLTKEATKRFLDAWQRSTVAPVFAHASYLITLATSDGTTSRRSATALRDELDRSARLGLDGLVLHPGAHLGTGPKRGTRRVARALDRVLERFIAIHSDSSTQLLLENTAGQGTYLGGQLEELAMILDHSRHHEKIGVCIDTCHAFAAGYSLTRRAGYERLIDDIDRLFGLDKLGCIHLNDSVGECRSHRDRHANLGHGMIGLLPFEWLINDPRLRAVPMILETPKGENNEGHRQDLERLAARSLSTQSRGLGVCEADE